MPGAKGRSGGHNRKSVEQLKADGGFRADRHGQRAELVIESNPPEPPPHLSELGTVIWNRIVGELPPAILNRLDSQSLSVYCDLCELYSKLRPKFLDDPIDPEIRIAYFGTLDRMDKIGRQFGWSPHSRSALQMPKTEDAKEEDNFAELMARMKGK